VIEKIRPAQKNVAFFKSDFMRELGLALINGGLFTPLFSLALAAILASQMGKILPYQLMDGMITSLPLSVQILFAAFLEPIITLKTCRKITACLKSRVKNIPHHCLVNCSIPCEKTTRGYAKKFQRKL
jgi:uncharacterized membrane protein